MGILTEKISGPGLSPGEGMVTGQIDTCIMTKYRKKPRIDLINSFSRVCDVTPKKIPVPNLFPKHCSIENETNFFIS